LTVADVGSTIRILETATNTGGTVAATSVATPVVAPVASGTPQVLPSTGLADGGTVSASSPPSDWDGATGLTFDYRFQHCGTTCIDAQTGTGSTYVLGPNDVGQTMRVIVEARSGPVGGPFSAPAASTSLPTDPVAPTARSAPGLTGGTQDGQTLTGTDANWNGVSGLTETFVFSRCAVGGSCTAMQSGSGTTYPLTGADMGSTIRLTVQASKGGSAVSTSPAAETAVISPHSTGVPAAPTATLLQDGGVLSASNGSWLDVGPSMSFSYQWFRCQATCTSIDDGTGTGQSYTLKAADVGQRMRVIVTAHVLTGATSATSLDTGVIAPLNTGPSVISLPSVVQDRQVFTTSDGDWNGVGGLSLSYQWFRCDQSGANCTASPIASGNQYTSTAADVGQTLRTTVFASKNASAITPSAMSAQTPVIAPFSTSAPTITGNPTDGQTLTATTSTASAWDNTPTALTFAYAWLRCDGTGASCTAIPGATGTTYLLTADDVSAAGDVTHARHQIRLEVSAMANGATTAARSAATDLIGARTTQNTELPQVSGGQFSNQALTVTSGAWTGTDIQVTTYQWIACGTPGVDSTCTNVGTATATANTYLVQPSDVGKFVTARVTVVNRAGDISSARAAFGGSAVMTNPLEATLGPVVTGPYIDGGVLTTTDGTWSPPDGLVFFHTWLRCAPNSDGTVPGGSSTCSRIPGATTASYTLTTADVGQYVVSRVEADVTTPGSIGISATQDSDIDESCGCDGAPRPVAAAPPVNTVAPTIAGAAKQGAILTASQGTWSGTNGGVSPMSFTYQWQRCDQDGASCQAITGETRTGYTTSALDSGFRLVVRVTATNRGGSQSASSAPTDVIVASVVQVSGGGTPGAALTGALPVTGSVPPGGVHATSLKTDKTAPKLVLSFLGGGTLVGGTTLRVNATCPKTEQTCKARFQLVATLKKATGKALAKPTTIAATTILLKSGQTALLKLKVSPAARTALKKTLRLKVTLIANVTDAAGNVTPKETKGITLRWKKA
ncbi:MAG: large repetitive protein, partial [Gaiellales bacterium]|nr:large repetitive protein [Gaiellales bacterium]